MICALISAGLEALLCWWGHDWTEWYWREDRYGLQRNCTRCPEREYVLPARVRLPRT